MSTYEPGQVCVATVKGHKGIRVMRSAPTAMSRLVWASSTAVNAAWWFSDDEVTDIRPLVALDLDDPEAYGCSAEVHSPAKIIARLMNTNSVAAHAIARQIAAQTKPPRIPEPGLWGVVEANRRELDGATDLATGAWVRVDAAVCRWQHTSGNYTADWSDLVDPTLVRPGIGDES